MATEPLHMEDSLVIDAPIEKVFAFIMDFGNTPKWHKNMTRVGFKSDAPPGLGSEYVWVESFAGKTMDLSGSITAWDPPNSFEWKPTGGPYKMSGGWTFKTVGSSTAVVRYSDTHLSGFMKLLSVIMVALAKNQVKKELAELKRLIQI